MNLNPLNLTKPEATVDQRLRKRYRAAIRQRGLCAFCTCRETTLGVAHCRQQPERQRGLCQDDGRLPKFCLDDNTIEEFRDAA